MRTAVGLVTALVLVCAAPADAQLVAAAAPLFGVAGSSLFNEDGSHPVITGLPRVVTFDDAAVNGACTNRSAYSVQVDWGGVGERSYSDVFPEAQTSPGICTYQVEGDYLYYNSGVYTYTVKVCRG